MALCYNGSKVGILIKLKIFNKIVDRVFCWRLSSVRIRGCYLLVSLEKVSGIELVSKKKPKYCLRNHF